MRFIDGADLDELVARDGPLEAMRAATIVGQVASALDAAHARGLVHRDVKPANVLLARHGQGDHAYLTDFGLSKQLGSSEALTRTGQCLERSTTRPRADRGSPRGSRTRPTAA